MSENTTKQRVKDLRGLLASNAIPLKAVAKRAGLSYRSVVNQLNVAMKSNIKSVSPERIEALENAALEIRDEKRIEPADA